MPGVVYVSIGFPVLSSSYEPSELSSYSPIVKSCIISREKFSSAAVAVAAYEAERAKVKYAPMIPEYATSRSRSRMFPKEWRSMMS